MEKKYFSKVYTTVQELGIQVFTEQSSAKFTELCSIKCGTLRKNYWKFHINYEKFYKFCRISFRKCLSSQLLNSSIDFDELFFFVYIWKIGDLLLWHSLNLLPTIVRKWRKKYFFVTHALRFSFRNSCFDIKFLKVV